MRLTFPNHKYLYTSYGISIASDYVLKKRTNTIKKFVYVGGISLEKGVDIILEYFSKHSDLELHLFGAMNQAQKAIFDSYTQYSNIMFYGPVSKEVLREHFKLMDVGIHPSRFDAYSLAVGEEIGSGLPVIVSDHTGIKDDVLRNGWGIVYETENYKSLDKAIITMRCLEHYNSYKQSIDDYINGSSHVEFGDSIVHMYNQLLG